MKIPAIVADSVFDSDAWRKLLVRTTETPAPKRLEYDCMLELI